jgi:photosynthetic reaction center cytochrome c subunit
MAHNSRLAVICISAICLLSGGFVLTVPAGPAGQAQQPRPQMAEEVFKNVQLLKGIPVDEFMDTMGMFASSLSLNCIDCHVAESVDSWDKFADDTQLKRITRTMMQMVTAINKDQFKGVRAVSCYTCHHGDLRPKIVPSLVVQYSAPEEDPNEVEIPPGAKGNPDDVFNKYIQALGGAQRLGALTSFSAKGTFIGFETEQTKVPMELLARSPNLRNMVVHTRIGDSTRVFDGRAAWIAAPDRPVGLLALTGGNLEGAKIDAMVSFPAQLKQAFAVWRVASASIDDKDVTVLQGTNPRQPPVNFYFDQSGLLVRVVRLVDTAVGRVPTQVDYSDYRAVAGVKMPFKWTTTWTDGQATTELTEVQPNVSIDAAKFARPAPAPRPK